MSEKDKRVNEFSPISEIDSRDACPTNWIIGELANWAIKILFYIQGLEDFFGF